MARGRVYNVIATEEELQNVNQKNLELYESWEMYLRAASRTPGTIKNYKCDVVSVFFGWLMKNMDNKDISEITPKDILIFQDYLMNELQMSPNRVIRIKDSLGSFGNYLRDFEGIETFHPAVRAVPKPKTVLVREVTELTDEDVKIIFDGLIEERKYMDACAVAMVLYGGLRKNDLPQIKAQWFNKNHIEGEFYKSPKKIKTKNDKDVYVFLFKKEVDRYLYLWKKERKALAKRQIFTEEGEEYLFIRRVDGRWTQILDTNFLAVSNHVNAILQKAGIEKTFYFEAGRQYYFDYIEKNVTDKNMLKTLKKNR